MRAFHDVDGDGTLDVNLFGQPLEPVGFSNNAQPRRGPPSWSAVRFQLPIGGEAQTISLR